MGRGYCPSAGRHPAAPDGSGVDVSPRSPVVGVRARVVGVGGHRCAQHLALPTQVGDHQGHDGDQEDLAEQAFQDGDGATAVVVGGEVAVADGGQGHVAEVHVREAVGVGLAEHGRADDLDDAVGAGEDQPEQQVGGQRGGHRVQVDPSVAEGLAQDGREQQAPAGRCRGTAPTAKIHWALPLTAVPGACAGQGRGDRRRSTVVPVTTAPKTRRVCETWDRLSVVSTSRASITADTTWPPV